MVVHALLRQFSKALFSESLPKALKTNQQHVKSHLLSEREYHPSERTIASRGMRNSKPMIKAAACECDLPVTELNC